MVLAIIWATTNSSSISSNRCSTWQLNRCRCNRTTTICTTTTSRGNSSSSQVRIPSTKGLNNNQVSNSSLNQHLMQTSSFQMSHRLSRWKVRILSMTYLCTITRRSARTGNRQPMHSNKTSFSSSIKIDLPALNIKNH